LFRPGRATAGAADPADRLRLRSARSEVLSLRVQDIDQAAGCFCGRQGKGNKDRAVPLSPRSGRLASALATLAAEDLAVFLAHAERPAVAGGVATGDPAGVAAAGFTKKVSLHTRGTVYATHLLEAASICWTIQRLLGHRDLQTTARYVHLTAPHLARTPGLWKGCLLRPAPPPGATAAAGSLRWCSARAGAPATAGTGRLTESSVARRPSCPQQPHRPRRLSRPHRASRAGGRRRGPRPRRRLLARHGRRWRRCSAAPWRMWPRAVTPRGGHVQRCGGLWPRGPSPTIRVAIGTSEVARGHGPRPG